MQMVPRFSIAVIGWIASTYMGETRGVITCVKCRGRIAIIFKFTRTNP